MQLVPLKIKYLKVENDTDCFVLGYFSSLIVINTFFEIPKVTLEAYIGNVNKTCCFLFQITQGLQNPFAQSPN